MVAVEVPRAGDGTEEIALVVSVREVLPGREWATNIAATPMKISEAAAKIVRYQRFGIGFYIQRKLAQSGSLVPTRFL